MQSTSALINLSFFLSFSFSLSLSPSLSLSTHTHTHTHTICPGHWIFMMSSRQHGSLTWQRSCLSKLILFYGPWCVYFILFYCVGIYIYNHVYKCVDVFLIFHQRSSFITLLVRLPAPLYDRTIAERENFFIVLEEYFEYAESLR